MGQHNNLYTHAKIELELSGLLDEDADYAGQLGVDILEIMELISRQGHSGGSIHQLVHILPRLMLFKPLTPLTDDPEEWLKLDKDVCGEVIWQNKRCPSVFSKDGGKTWVDMDKKGHTDVAAELGLGKKSL